MKEGFRQDGRDIYLGDEKIGGFPEGRDVLQMLRGKKPYREAVLKWLGREDGPEDDEEEPEEEKASEKPKAKAKDPGKPPEGAKGMGDKDPAVIAWWFEHRPEEARRRYANANFAGKEQYFKK